MPVVSRLQGLVPQASAHTITCMQLSHWAEIADADFIGYVRMRESKRTVEWLVEAGLLDQKDPRTRFEVQHCLETIRAMPRFDFIRPGETTWKGQKPKRRARHSLPPPVPAWTKRSRPSTDG